MQPNLQLEKSVTCAGRNIITPTLLFTVSRKKVLIFRIPCNNIELATMCMIHAMMGSTV
jgi:hypothetical protein